MERDYFIVGGLLSVLIGYGFGCINNAAFFSKLKHKDMRETGTGNLGATNAVIVLGRAYGIVIMLLDILKAYVAYKVASLLFASGLSPNNYGLLAGLGAIIGHVFPFYMKFKGGKGLAAFGGTVLAHSPMMFFILLGFVTVLLLIVNYSFVVPYGGSVIFAIIATIYAPREDKLFVGIVTAIIAIIIMYKHFPNFKKGLSKSDVGVREYVMKYVFHHKS